MSSLNTISPFVKFGLRFSGIWPGTPFPLMHKFIWVTVLSVLQIYQYRYIIMHFRSEDLMDLVNNLSITMSISMVLIKLIVTWVNYGSFSDIIYTMEEDCQNYAIMDVHNLISKTGQFSYYVTSMIMGSCLVAVMFYITGTVGFQGTNDTISRELLFKMDLPFEAYESPNYELIVTIQFLIHFSVGIAFGTFSALLLMVVFHAGCQIDIMCRYLMEVTNKNENHIKFFINRYQEIIIFTQKIEKLFTYIALGQLVSNTIVTCCKGFLIVIAINENQGAPILIQSILFYAVICLEVFIYCFAGEYLRIKSKLLGDAAYDYLWYDLPAHESQLLVPVILRSQKGFTLTFGKFSNLSLESFTNIMKLSTSYMSVLLAAY